MVTTIMMAAVATVIIVGSAGSYIAMTEVKSDDLQKLCDEKCTEVIPCHAEGENYVCDLNIDMSEPSYEECMASCTQK